MSEPRLLIHTRERRYLFPDAAAVDALLRTRLGPVEYVAGRPESRVATVYLDTPEGTWSAGRARTKFRCKSYDGGASWWFELKRRVGNVVDKWRRPVPPDALPALLGGGRRWEELRPFAGDRPLRPLAVVLYARTAFEAGGLRVTLDRDVAFHRVSDGAPWAAGERIGGVAGVVVEVKRDGPVPAWLAPALKGRRAKDFSKSRRVLAALGRAKAPSTA